MSGQINQPKWQHRLIGAVIGGLLAMVTIYVALDLTLGMLFARHLTSAQQAQLERVTFWAATALGMILGASYSPRWLSEQTRWICWGSVVGVAGVFIGKVGLDLLTAQPTSAFPIQIAGRTVSLEELALSSVPCAVLTGGIIGGFLYRQIGRRRQRSSDSSQD